jgi:hypothetical protein
MAMCGWIPAQQVVETTDDRIEGSNRFRSANTSYADSLSARASALESPGIPPFLADGCAPWAVAEGLEICL